MRLPALALVPALLAACARHGLPPHPLGVDERVADLSDPGSTPPDSRDLSMDWSGSRRGWEPRGARAMTNGAAVAPEQLPSDSNQAASEQPSLDAATSAAQSGAALPAERRVATARGQSAGPRPARAGAAASGGPPAGDDAGGAAASEVPAGDAATEEDSGPAPPPLSSLNRDAITKLLEDRLDIGAYRVQIAPNDDFSDGQVLFDKTYDVMENINLFDEFKAAGVNIDRSAYWVRIAFIDLLQDELPWTKPRLYGLNKQRLDTP